MPGSSSTSESGKRPGVKGGTMKPMSVTPSITICACCCGARPRAPFGKSSISIAPPAALFTAATHGFFTVLYRRSVSGEKVAILSFTGCATAAIGTQASSAATTIFRISLTSLGFMFHRPFRDVAAAREPDAFVLLRVLQHLSRDRDQRRPRTHVRVQRELAPLGTAGLALRVELVEGRLPVLPHELRRRAR